jgi:hypothetical protein
MTQPAVNITELDGALGVLPPSSGRLMAVVGPASAGTVNLPAAFNRVSDLVANFTGGPGVEAAAREIELYGKPVLFVRTAASVLGAYLDAVDAEDGAISAITKTGTGSSVFTDNASDPVVAADVQVLFVVGGTRGVTGIVYQISLDGGNTWGPPLALGTAVTFAVAATGASIAVGAGTIVAGDFISFTLTAPILASAGELVVDFSGSSVPTIDGTTHPADDYEVYVEFVAGGTRGVAGITYQWSLDGGRTMSPVTALGTATSITIPGSGGVKVNLGVGTITAGDNFAFPTVAPRWNTSELGDALDALKTTSIAWEFVQVAGPLDSDAIDMLETKIPGMAQVGKNRWWIGSARMPVGSESDATYTASLSSALGSKATKYGAVCAGACEYISSVSGRKYKRPVAHVAGAIEASVSEEVNVANINVGLLNGVSLYDALGNPKHHDESLNPGLADARFYVLRTWGEDAQGIYVNEPLLFSPAGSDFQLVPHRRVMNIARDALRAYFVRRLNDEVLVDGTTGYILERERLEIEAGALSAMTSALRAKPKASAVRFALSRTDNLLSTKTLTGQARVVPLGYIKFINLDVGFLNPALQVRAV